MLSFIKEFLIFLLKRKKFWIFNCFCFVNFWYSCFVTQGTAIAPFIYTIFKMKRIIGISAFYHDSAVALIENGKIVYASQEERFSRLKHDHRFPFLALKIYLNLIKFP